MLTNFKRVKVGNKSIQFCTTESPTSANERATRFGNRGANCGIIEEKRASSSPGRVPSDGKYEQISSSLTFEKEYVSGGNWVSEIDSASSRSVRFNTREVILGKEFDNDSKYRGHAGFGRVKPVSKVLIL